MRTARTPPAPGHLRVTFFPGGHLPEGETVEGDFDSLCRALKAVARLEKSLSCGWGPYTLDSPRRHNKAVEELWLDVIDVDGREHRQDKTKPKGATPEEWAAILKALEPFRYAWHHTHAHKPENGLTCARILIPFVQPVLAVDWKTYRGGTPWASHHDPATSDACRFYYCPPLGADIRYHEGELVDPYQIIDPSTKGYEAKIARVGDGLGRKGFQATIVPAIAAYVSAGRDTRPEALERLKEDIRSRIDAAPKRHDRPAEEIARYKSDEFLNTAIKGALAKYNPAPPSAALYTEDDIAKLAAAEGWTSEVYMQRLILTRGATRYIRLGDTYQVSSVSDAVVGYRHNLSNYALQWQDPATGKPNGREALERLYATNVGRVTYDGRIDRAIVREQDRELILHLPCAKMKPGLQPVFSSAVDSWINSTSNPNAVRAYMADVYNLDRALFALILWGPGGTGKSSFAEGLARAWSEGATKASTVFPEGGKSAWTAPLLDNPLVFADERAPACSVRRLREFLGTDVHSITRKYEHDAVFTGYPRLVIAGNDESVGMRLTDAEPDEIGATAVRFQSVYVPNTVTIDWAHFVDGLGLAQHALWLRANHPIARDSEGRRYRFGLPPDSRFAEMLSVSGDVPTRVLQWLVSALANPGAVQCIQRIFAYPSGGWVSIQGAGPAGWLILSPDMLSRQWGCVADGPQKPTLGELRAALKTICQLVTLPGPVTALAARPERLRQWCEQYGAQVPPAVSRLV